MTFHQLCDLRATEALANGDVDELETGHLDCYSMVLSPKAETLTLDDIGFLLGGLELHGGKDFDSNERRALEHALEELLVFRGADAQAEAAATPEEKARLAAKSRAPFLELVSGGRAA